MHTKSFMSCFFCIYIICFTFLIDPLSAESEFNIFGHVGSTVVLPCELPNVVTERPNVRWFNDYETVFERMGEMAYQAAGYEGRVDIAEKELQKKNCSMVLHNLTMADAAVYKSCQIVKFIKRSGIPDTTRIMISSVKLTVYDSSSKGINKAMPPSSTGMTEPHLLLIVLSFISCIFGQPFC